MAGIAGEQLVATELGRVLDDDWTLLRGYRNRRGEIDQLLLGPRGLDRGQRAAIGGLIRRDHEFHGRHRRAGTRPPR